MTTSLMDNQGEFRVLREAVPLPAVLDVHQSPFMHMCFPVSWQPHILLALKMLTRPETFLGSRADIAVMCESAHTLMGEIEDGCYGPITAMNWILGLQVLQGAGPVNDDWLIPPVPPIDDRFYEGIFTTAFGLPPVVRVRGVDFSNPTLDVGGNWISYEMDSTTGAAKVYTIQTWDCFGVTQVYSGLTPYNSPHNGEFKAIQFAIADGDMSIRASINGNWTCGPV